MVTWMVGPGAGPATIGASGARGNEAGVGASESAAGADAAIGRTTSAVGATELTSAAEGGAGSRTCWMICSMSSVLAWGGGSEGTARGSAETDAETAGARADKMAGGGGVPAGEARTAGQATSAGVKGAWARVGGGVAPSAGAAGGGLSPGGGNDIGADGTRLAAGWDATGAGPKVSRGSSVMRADARPDSNRDARRGCTAAVVGDSERRRR